MLNRFYQNYDHPIIDTPKAVVYLSHPQWFQSKESQDEAKMELILNSIDDHLYSEDKGPVFYVTMNDIYELWK